MTEELADLTIANFSFAMPDPPMEQEEKEEEETTKDPPPNQ
jgi:hypothetical protein